MLRIYSNFSLATNIEPMENYIKISYRHQSIAELPADERMLVEKAEEMCSTAYAPYSSFRVGAAALLRSGRIEVGSNQESEVFPSGICAERSLLFHHQATASDDPIVAIAIASNPSQSECYPCGGCRQVLVDTERRQSSPIKVIMSGAGTATVVERASDLMPFTFSL